MWSSLFLITVLITHELIFYLYYYGLPPAKACDEFLISNHVLASLSVVYALIDFTPVFTFAIFLSKIINNDTRNTFLVKCYNEVFYLCACG